MNRIIRRGCFETNSSSSHSLTLCLDPDILLNLNKDYLLLEDENGDICVEGRYYGWTKETFSSTIAKLSYVFSLVYTLYGDNWSTSEDGMFLLKTLKNATGKNFVFNPGDESLVDHQSVHLIDELFRNKRLSDKVGLDFSNILLSFLFNEVSELHTGNDNEDDDLPEEGGVFMVVEEKNGGKNIKKVSKW